MIKDFLIEIRNENEFRKKILTDAKNIAEVFGAMHKFEQGNGKLRKKKK